MQNDSAWLTCIVEIVGDGLKAQNPDEKKAGH